MGASSYSVIFGDAEKKSPNFSEVIKLVVGSKRCR